MPTFDGTSRSDVLTGTEENDELNGLGGNDTLIGLGGNDRLVGGAGTDRLTGGAGQDIFFEEYADLANDSVTDFQIDDTINIGLEQFRSTLTGTGTLDVTYIRDNPFTGIPGQIRYEASGGQTRIQFDKSGNGVADREFIIENYEGPLEITFFFGALQAVIDQRTRGTTGEDDITGTDGDDRIATFEGDDVQDGGAGQDQLDGGLGNDTLNGGRDADELLGGEGDDILRGGSGQDTLRGGNGDDILDGGSGNDFLSSGNGNDTLIGGTGDDSLSGDDGDEVLDGGEGDDSLSGGDGNDTLIGGAGNDSISGGDDEDVIFGGEGTDSIDGGDQDFLIFDGGGDTLSYENALSGLNGQFTGDNERASNNILTTLESRSSVSRVERLIGTDFDDTVVVPLLDGESGVYIDAGDGDDDLTGSQWRDWLVGGEGDDRLTTTNGADRLDGGEGSDTAIFSGQTEGVSANLIGGTFSGTHTRLSIQDVRNDDFPSNPGLLRTEFLFVSDIFETRDNSLLVTTNDISYKTEDAETGVRTRTFDYGAFLVPVEGEDVVADPAPFVQIQLVVNFFPDGARTFSVFMDFYGVEPGLFSEINFQSNGFLIDLPSGTIVDMLNDPDVVSESLTTVGELIGIENLSGTVFSDTLQGDDGANLLSGDAGDDIIFGEATTGLTGLEGEVFRAYQAIFNRNPDIDGYTNFANAYRAGDLTLNDIVTEFVGSDEFQLTYGNLEDAAFVETLYTNVLPGNTDAEGRALFTAALQAETLSRTDMVLEFVNTPEFVLRSVTSSSAFVTSQAIFPEEAAVFRIYQAVFNRAPDDGGFLAFVNALQANVLTVEQITAEFVESDEFNLTYGELSNADFVNTLYVNVLPGNEDTAGRANFTAALDSGRLRRADVVAEFAQSPEFQTRTNDAAQDFVATAYQGSNDIINGGLGDDMLYGGRGADSFAFDVFIDGQDTILDFEVGRDTLNLFGDDAFDTFAEVISAATQVGNTTVIDFGRGNSLTLNNILLTTLTETDFDFTDVVSAEKIEDVPVAEDVGRAYALNPLVGEEPDWVVDALI